MKPSSLVLTNTNITFSLDKIHTSFLLPALFHELLGSPENFIQIPDFGMLDYKLYNLVVDGNNKKIMLNHKEPIPITDSVLPEMANIVRAIESIEINAIGFNFVLDLTFDANYEIYSANEFLKEKYVKLFGSKLKGFGMKAFMQEENLRTVISVEPKINDASHAVANVNYHYTSCDMNINSKFTECYHSFEGFLNGLFTE